MNSLENPTICFVHCACVYILTTVLPLDKKQGHAFQQMMRAQVATEVSVLRERFLAFPLNPGTFSTQHDQEACAFKEIPLKRNA